MLQARTTVALLLLAAAPQVAHAQSRGDMFATSYRYEQSQSYDDAIKAITPLYMASQYDYLVNLRLGWLYYLNGNYANSRQHYQLAIRTNNKSVEARLGYMLPLLAAEQYEAAETTARQVTMIDPNNYTANLRLAYALRWQGKYSQAQKINQRMLELYPTDVSLLLEQALVYAALGSTRDSQRLLEEVLLLDPENVTARQQLAGK